MFVNSAARSTLFARHKRTLLAIAFVFIWAASVSYAVPPTSSYQPGETLDPTCAPGESNCTVALFPEQAGNAGKLLTTNGTTVSWNDTFSGLKLSNTTLNTGVILSSSITPSSNLTYDIGSPAYMLRNIYVDTITANSISAGNSAISGSTAQDFTFNSDNTSADTEDITLIFDRGTEPNALFSWNSTANQFEFDQPLAITTLGAGVLRSSATGLLSSDATTSDLSEGTNLYYTDARVYTAGDTRYPKLSESYTNPSWITSLPWSKITATPTTLAGYGITDAAPISGSANYIQNQNSTAQTADMYISGSSRADTGGIFGNISLGSSKIGTTSGDNLQLVRGGTTRAAIGSDSFYPYTSGTDSLGNASRSWKNLYLSGNAMASAAPTAGNHLTNKTYVDGQIAVLANIDGSNATGTWPISIAGSAPTLTTARTLWGQSFDGSADISGALTDVTGITTSGGYTQSGTNANTFTGTTTFSNSIYSALFTGGNVGIGDTNPSALLTVGNGDLFQVNSSGAIAAATGITTTGTLTLSTALTTSAGPYTILTRNTSTGVVESVASTVFPSGSGTANYIPKFTSANTLGNSLLYDNGTSVSIATTYADSNAALVVRNSSNFGGLTVRAPDGPRIFFDEGSNGSETQRAFFGLQNQDNAFVMRNWGGSGSDVLFSVQGGGSRTSTPAANDYKLTLLHNGNLGLGTTAPDAKLHALATTEQLRLGYDASNYAAFTVDASSNVAIVPGTSDTASFSFGYFAGKAAGSNFLGYSAGNGATSATYSNFLGYGAGGNATSAAHSNFFGTSAGSYATSAAYSNFIGDTAGYSATAASSSNFIGDSAGISATNASSSNFLGYSAGYNATNAKNSIFIGTSAGANDTVNNTTSGSSILIGANTNTGGFSNSIGLGAGAINTASNQLLIGSTYTQFNMRGINYTMPDTQAVGVLTNDGSGILSWAPGNSWDNVTGGINYAGGNVGIGATTLTSPLTILAQSNTIGTTAIGFIAPSISSTQNSFGIRLNTAGDFNIDRRSSMANFNTLTILRASGNVGINTASPGAKLEIATDFQTVAFTPSGARDKGITITNSFASGNGAYSHFGITFQGNESTNGYSGIYNIHDGADTNALAFVTSNGTIAAEAMRIAVNGNVGIGTTSPDSRLTVVNTTAIQATFAGYAPITGNATNTAGSIAVGSTAAYQGVLQYTAAGNTALSLENTFDDANATMQFRMRTAGTPVVAMTILGSGKVGIGTTNPGTKLEVNGDIRALGGTNALVGAYAANSSSSQLVLGNSVGTSHWAIYEMLGAAGQQGTFNVYDAVVGASRISVSPTGYVGIGTNSPNNKLDIQDSGSANIHILGNTDSSGYGDSGIIFGVSQQDYWQNYIYASGATAYPTLNWYSLSTGANAMTLTTSGNLTISGTLSQSSDYRLKDNITLLDGQSWTLQENITTQDDTIMDRIMALRPVTYTMKSDQSGQMQSGFIAQEVKDIFPNLVALQQQAKGGGEARYVLNYVGLMPYTIAAIQEMNLNIVSIGDLNRANSWRDSLLAWFADTANGIGDFVAGTLRAKDQICIDDVCMTKDQLRAMINNSNEYTQYDDGAAYDGDDEEGEVGEEVEEIVTGDETATDETQPLDTGDEKPSGEGAPIIPATPDDKPTDQPDHSGETSDASDTSHNDNTATSPIAPPTTPPESAQ